MKKSLKVIKQKQIHVSKKESPMQLKQIISLHFIA